MATDITTLGWGTVQDQFGNARPGIAFSLTRGGTVILAGTTNTNGQMVGSLDDGYYTLTVTGVASPIPVLVSSLVSSVNVESYGAHPSYSAAVNGAAFQAALDAIPDSLPGQLLQTGGRGLYVPSYNGLIWNVDRALFLRANGTCVFSDSDGAHVVAPASVWPTFQTDEARNCRLENLHIDGGVWLTQPSDGNGEANNYIRHCRVRCTGASHITAVRMGNTDGTFGMGCHIGEDCVLTHTEATIGRNAVECYGVDNMIIAPRVTSYYGPAVLLDSKGNGGGGVQVMGGHYFGITANGAAACAFRIRGGNMIQIDGVYTDNYRQGPTFLVDPPTGQGVSDLRIGSGTPLVGLKFRNAADSADVDATYPLVKLDTSGGGTIENVTIADLHGHTIGVSSRWSYIVDATAGVRWRMRGCHMRDVATGLYNPAGPPSSFANCSYKDGTNWNEFDDRPLQIAPGGFFRSAGVTYVLYGGSRGQALNFPDAATETIYDNIPIPVGWSVAKVTVVWTIGAAGAAGQVARFFINTNSFVDGSATNVADTQVTLDLTAPAQDTLKYSVMSSTVAVTGGSMLRFRLARDGAHANDTLAGPALVCRVNLERVR